MSNSLTGSLSPEEAIPDALNCANQRSFFFIENGHLYTTYKIAILAGVDIQAALILAYFSQYPDIDSEFNAVNQFHKIFTRKRKFVMKKLHSLHGGNSLQISDRKSRLKIEIKDLLLNREYWKAGILIHSLGDAFAHTKGKLDTPKEEAYGPILGHGVDSAIQIVTGINRDPDDIDREVVREKYIAYINDLFELLRTENANESGMHEFTADINVDHCIDQICPIFKVLKDSDEIMLNRYIKCMNKSMRSLAEDEVKSLYEKI